MRCGATEPGQSILASSPQGESIVARDARLAARLATVETTRLGLENARAKMRATLITTVGDLNHADFTRLVENSRILVQRLTARISTDVEGSGYDKTKARKDPDGKYAIQTNFAWSKAVIIEELTELAELDHKEFISIFERAVTPCDDSLGPMKESLLALVENMPHDASDYADPAVDVMFEAEKLVTHLYHEPRATLLEWGALAANTDDVGLRTMATVLHLRAAKITPEHHNSQNHLVDLALWTLLMARAWARCGFPMLAPTHKLAASLMATETPREVVPELALPWTTFALLVPPGLLPDNRSAVKMVGLSKMSDLDLSFFGTVPDFMAAHGETQYLLWMANERHAMLYSFPLASLADLADLPPSALHGMDNATVEERAAFGLLARLLLGAMIELDQPKHAATIAKGPPRKRAAAKKSTDYDAASNATTRTTFAAGHAWAFALTRDVRVDLRGWVRGYVAGGGTKASVRVLRRGHHRRQPYGPKSELRKWIHIEPTWVNREASVVAVRAHTMTERADGKDE